MAYNTNTYFAVFLPAVCLLYQLVPSRHRWKVLLGASAAFFWLISRFLIGWCLGSTLILYLSARKIEEIRCREQKGDAGQEVKSRLQEKEKWICILGVFLVAAILAALKYHGIASGILHRMARRIPTVSMLAAPIGISFYTLQGIGYLLDVYWGRTRAEKNYFRLCLFMMFFPSLMEGPILNWQDMSERLFRGDPITDSSFYTGLVRILWGLFKRMLVSDRMDAMVVSLFGGNVEITGLMTVITVFVATVQLYLEFSGTIDIVIGSAQLFGIRLPENFRQPFLAKSAAEFWRRWHITLGAWFRNYIFFPVTTSEPVKKWNRYGRRHYGKYITMVVTSFLALCPVWILNGIWHGSEQTALLFGIYYLVILQAELMLKPAVDYVLNVLHVRADSRFVRILALLKTWIVIGVGETLFRAGTWSFFVRVMGGLFRPPFDGHIRTGQLLELGVDTGDLVVIVVGILIVLLVELRWEKNPDMFERVYELPALRRCAIIYLMVMLIVLFGAYGAGYARVDLIYAGF